MPKKTEKGEVIFDIARDKNTASRATLGDLSAIRRIINHGWEEGQRFKFSEMVLAEQTVGRFVKDLNTKDVLEKSFKNLRQADRTQVIRRFIYQCAVEGKLEKAFELNVFESVQKESDLNIILIAVYLQKQERFDQALDVLQKVSDAELKEDMARIIEQDKRLRLTN